MGILEEKPVGRLTWLLLVGLLHVALIYALTQGLARKVIEVVRNPLEVKIVETAKPPVEKPPPLPTPKLAPPSLPRIAPPEVKVQPPPPPALPAVTPAKPVEPAPAPAPAPAASAPAPPQPGAGSGQGVAARPHVPVRTPAVVDARACEKPRYPPASVRANETGTVLLSFLIDVTGKVLESRVDRSSGFNRLDEAARNGLALCKFKPATVDGKPEQSWAKIEYEWKLVD